MKNTCWQALLTPGSPLCERLLERVVITQPLNLIFATLQHHATEIDLLKRYQHHSVHSFIFINSAFCVVLLL